MAYTVVVGNINVFKNIWATCTTYYTVPKAFPGTAIFGSDILSDVPFLVDWNKIGEHKQHQTDLNMKQQKLSLS